MIVFIVAFYFAYPYLGLSPKPKVTPALSVDNMVSTMIATNPVLSAQTIIAVTVSPSPSPSPSPAPSLDLGVNIYPPVVSTPVPELSMHLFSFYDPAIGKDKPEIAEVNCSNWDYANQTCVSALRNGEAWQDNYFVAAACPYSLYMQAAQFQVVSPSWLRDLFPNGFTCKDTGELVTGLYIDFLIPWRSMPMDYSLVPWGAPVALIRIK